MRYLPGFWETYKLDSITGQWDYVEPALFGYAAGKLIESFTTFYHEHHNIIAQFHEWMTGTGILYLKKYAPWIATSFTTHATVLGRCIAGNNRPLYGKMKEYNPCTDCHGSSMLWQNNRSKKFLPLKQMFLLL